MDIKIRDILKKDIPDITNLILNIYREKPYALNFDNVPDKIEILNLLSYKILFCKKKLIIDKVAINSSNMVIGECEIIKSDNDISSKTGIIGIIINKRARRKGMGSILLKTSIKEAKKLNLENVLAIVSIRNKEAINFFKKNNFKEINSKEKNKTKKIIFELKLKN